MNRHPNLIERFRYRLAHWLDVGDAQRENERLRERVHQLGDSRDELLRRSVSLTQRVTELRVQLSLDVQAKTIRDQMVRIAELEQTLKDKNDGIVWLKQQMWAASRPIDPNAACPACGARRGKIRWLSEFGDGQKKGVVMHTCAECGANWGEQPLAAPDQWTVEIPPELAAEEGEPVGTDGVRTVPFTMPAA